MHLQVITVTFLQCIHYATVKCRETRGEQGKENSCFLEHFEKLYLQFRWVIQVAQKLHTLPLRKQIGSYFMCFVKVS